MNAKIKFLTLAVILIFGAWVIFRLRQQAPAPTNAPVAVAKPVSERFMPGVHY